MELSEARNTELTLAWIRQAPRADRDDEPVPPVDAWRLLQKARLVKARVPEQGSLEGRVRGMNAPLRRIEIDEPEAVAEDDPLRNVGLDHVLYVGKSQLDRFARTNPMAVVDRFARTNPSAGPESYGHPGTGGLEVVTYVGAEPVARHKTQDGGRRPVVVVIDTGCGEHPWLPEKGDQPDPSGPWVWRRVTGPNPRGCSESRRRLPIPRSTPTSPVLTTAGSMVRRVTARSSPASSGRSVADSNVIAIRIADSDGSVLESELIQALEELVERMDDSDDPLDVDVINLSLGFYHETPDDGRFSTRLYDVLKDLRQRGVVVVCSAGNDSTDRPAFPAALWDWGDKDLQLAEPAGIAPHFSVGALNPTLQSVALYSNVGDWVRIFSPGSSVLSTIPASFEGGVQSGSRADRYGLKRTTIDVDDFSGGFAIWSGTSFAAPFVAGFIAQEMAAELTATGTRPTVQAEDLLARLTGDGRVSRIAPAGARVHDRSDGAQD